MARRGSKRHGLLQSRAVAWDRDRPVPWKRLFTFVGIYSLVVFGLFAVLQPDRMLQSFPGLLFGAGVAVTIMAILSKFGWQPTMLKSKDQIAADRAAREESRAAAKAARSSKGSGGKADEHRRRPCRRCSPGQAGAHPAHEHRADELPAADQGHPEALTP